MTDLSGSYRKYFDTRFLAADDMPPGKDYKLTIAHVTKEEVHGGDKVLALRFKETPKMLAVNKTNAENICKALGTPEVQDWIGRQVTIFGTTCRAFGDPKCPCIRVKYAARPRTT